MSYRILVDEYVEAGTNYKEIAGHSDDTKPVTGLATGSQFFEIDTGKTYYFDEDGTTGNEWVDPTASS